VTVEPIISEKEPKEAEKVEKLIKPEKAVIPVEKSNEPVKKLVESAEVDDPVEAARIVAKDEKRKRENRKVGCHIKRCHLRTNSISLIRHAYMSE